MSLCFYCGEQGNDIIKTYVLRNVDPTNSTGSRLPKVIFKSLIFEKLLAHDATDTSIVENNFRVRVRYGNDSAKSHLMINYRNRSTVSAWLLIRLLVEVTLNVKFVEKKVLFKQLKYTVVSLITDTVFLRSWCKSKRVNKM